ncbi:MAG: OmpA family protein [Myxococcales bacterium]|nr:MAG: OmpA family protein [Myxococcales bacterium]
MRRSWILPCLGGMIAWACVAPARAQSDPGPDAAARAARLTEVQNSFSGPTGGIRIIDASSGPKGTFRLALNTEFFIISDFFVPTDEAHHFAGNLSLSISATEYLEVFAAAEVTSAWDDSNDPMLIQRVADVLLGLKGFYQAKPWVVVGGDASLAFLGGVGDAKATLRSTSFGFRGNVTLDFREYERRDLPLIARFNAQYWFDNSAKLTEGIEDRRYDAFGGAVPRPLETGHLLTAFERFAYGVNRTDFVRLATGLEAPLKARNVGLHPMLEWQWDIPVNRQGFVCATTAKPNDDGCLAHEKLKAFPMVLTFGLRILTPPKGLAFTVGADVGLTGTRNFVRELAPTAPYNVLLGIAYAFDPRPATPVSPAAGQDPVVADEPTGEVRGRVLEQGSETPVSDAVVAVVGRDISPQVTDSEGRFVTYGLPEGEVVLEVSHRDYQSAQCHASVPSEPVCELAPSSDDGRLRVLAVDREGNPIPQIEITVRGPSEHRLISDKAGVATVDGLQPGAYTAHVDDPAYLIAVADLDIRARQETTVQLRILPKPTRPGVVVKKNEIALRRQVSFATGSDEILPNSEPILLEVADVLLRNPSLELVEIQGHTDNVGNQALNMRLSQQRAEAVQTWLIEHGVEPARLMAKGYGPTRPLAPNITQRNRARNRRVQFRIVRRADLSAAAGR